MAAPWLNNGSNVEWLVSSGSDPEWLPVARGESGDPVFRRHDGLAYLKKASGERIAGLAEECARLAWLATTDIAGPRVLFWQDADDGARLFTTAVPGLPASDLPADRLLEAWPSIVEQIAMLHRLPAAACPFDRNLAVMVARAESVVARNAVNPDFLPDHDKSRSPAELLARVVAELPARFDQEIDDLVVCHGDACLPNIMVDPATLRCTGLIDLGRLGRADRYADLALLLANAQESWTSSDQAERARSILFETLGIEPDHDRLAFYLRLDPLTWPS